MKQETDLEQFDREWLEKLEHTPFARLITALGGLTRLGERPASLERLAAIVGRPADETAALVREAFTARIEGDLIYWDEPFPGDQTRRMLYIGDREVPMRRGCAPDLFCYAVVLDVPFRAEETCPATGAPIRVDFVPGGYERADPPEAVTVLLPPGRLAEATFSEVVEQVDASVCNYQPFIASAQAAEAMLAAHPGSRAFTVKEMFERPFVTDYRDKLRPLI
jgi:alkylmercury lyase